MKQSTMVLVIAGIAVLVIGAIAFMMMQEPSMENGDTNGSTQDMQNQDSMNIPSEEKNIVAVAQEAREFSTLLAAAEAAGLVETLTGAGPFTVFAPTDEAFNKLPEGTIEALLEDTEQLRQVLTYHVVPGIVMASDIANLTSATTVQGGDITISVENGSVMVNNATVITADIQASNGVIHVIDTVLLPE